MKPILLAIAAGLCWGIGEACTRSALHDGRVGPFTALMIRTLIALPVILLAWWLMLKGAGGLHVEPPVGEMNASAWVKIIVGSGLLAGALGIIFFYGALSIGELSVVKPIAFALAPAIAVLLGWLVLGESMTPRKGIAIVLIITGVVLLTVQPPDPAKVDTVAESGS